MNAPESRNEAILQNMLGADNTLGEPQSPIETLLQELLAKLGGGSGDPQVDYKILNKQTITITHSSESRANYNAYLIMTQVGIVYVKIVNGEGTTEVFAGYPYTVTATVEETTVTIDLGYEWNVGVIVPIISDYIQSVTFA